MAAVITHAFRATMFLLIFFYLLTLVLALAIVLWHIMASGAAQSPFAAVMIRAHISGELESSTLSFSSPRSKL